MKFKLTLISLSLLAIISCSNSDIDIQEVRGTVRSSTNLNGLIDCQWLVSIAGELYVPTYLNAQYREDGLEVLMHVEFMTQLADCASISSGPALIRIEQIRPRN